MPTTKVQISLPGHPQSLISAFVVHCLDSIIPTFAISKVSTIASFCIWVLPGGKFPKILNVLGLVKFLSGAATNCGSAQSVVVSASGVGSPGFKYQLQHTEN